MRLGFSDDYVFPLNGDNVQDRFYSGLANLSNAEAAYHSLTDDRVSQVVDCMDSAAEHIGAAYALLQYHTSTLNLSEPRPTDRLHPDNVAKNSVDKLIGDFNAFTRLLLKNPDFHDRISGGLEKTADLDG